MMRLIAVLIVCLASRSSFAATLLNSGWEYQLGEKIDSSQGWTPIEKPCLSGTTAEWAWFRTLVKSPFVPEPVLFLHMMDQPFEARIGDQTVYSFGNLNSKSRANFFGFPWHFVPLNSYSEVKEVVFKVRSNHSDHIGLCREIQVGSKSEIIKSLIRSDAKVILVSMIFLIIGLASLVASFFTRTTSPYGTFGALASLIGLWIGTTPENHVKQLILDNATFWVHVDQISLYLIPAAFIAFLTDVFGDGIFRIEKWMKRFYLAFAVSSLIGSICGFLTLDVTHRIFNKVIPFSFAITISNSILLAIKGEKKARLLTGGILCFLMFAVHDWLVGTWVLKWHNLVMHWGFLLFICFLLAILHAHVRELLDVNTRQRLADARTHAIARTTQALAHDVRKPFSMFKSIIQVIEGTEDPNEVRKVLQLTLPEVNQAMASVEGMIQDVMQIGSDATMNLEDSAPSTLIEAALGDLFRIYPEADVSLSYDFSHRHMVRADSLRVERVFANILGNAMQAMRERGNLWIRTLERDGFIEFTLGNGGSHIPHESLPKLFDAFFTSGKKGGTGLGLAIAKKIVEAHGGVIRCVSEISEAFPQGMVEFVFTLPVAQSICAPRLEALPRTSREIQSALAGVRIVASRQEGMGADPREAEIEGAILQRINQLPATRPKALTVLVVEDEGVYRNGLLSLLERSEDLSRHVRMVFAHNDREAIAAIEEHDPVLVIEDVDLGLTSKDGIEIVTMLRAKGFKGHICVHSNRFLAGDNRAALAAGADTVLPKPLGRAHFLKLLLASLPEIPAVGSASVGARETPNKLSVAMIDDSVSMRLAWKVEIGKHTDFRSFASSGAFLDECDREEFFLSHLEVVVTDYNFAPGDPLDGGTLARELRRRGYQGLILLASGQANLGSEVEALFDADIGKSALAWPEFKAKVAKVHESRNRI